MNRVVGGIGENLCEKGRERDRETRETDRDSAEPDKEIWVKSWGKYRRKARQAHYLNPGK